MKVIVPYSEWLEGNAPNVVYPDSWGPPRTGLCQTCGKFIERMGSDWWDRSGWAAGYAGGESYHIHSPQPGDIYVVGRDVTTLDRPAPVAR